MDGKIQVVISIVAFLAFGFSVSWVGAVCVVALIVTLASALRTY